MKNDASSFASTTLSVSSGVMAMAVLLEREQKNFV